MTGLALLLSAVCEVNHHGRPKPRKRKNWQGAIQLSHGIWNGSDLAVCVLRGHLALREIVLMSFIYLFFTPPLESCGASRTSSAKTLPSVLAAHNRRGPGGEKEPCRRTTPEHSAPASSIQLENGKGVEFVATAHPSSCSWVHFSSKADFSNVSYLFSVIASMLTNPAVFTQFKHMQSYLEERAEHFYTTRTQRKVFKALLDHAMHERLEAWERERQADEHRARSAN